MSPQSTCCFIILTISLLFAQISIATPSTGGLESRAPQDECGPEVEDFCFECDIAYEGCECYPPWDFNYDVLCGTMPSYTFPDPDLDDYYDEHPFEDEFTPFDELKRLARREDSDAFLDGPAVDNEDRSPDLLSGQDPKPYPAAVRRSTSLHRREIVQKVNYPLFAAIGYIGLSTITQSARKVILNRLPVESRGRFVTGLQGHLPKAITVIGQKFLEGATWEIRWDINEDGAHVNMALSDNINRESYAFFLQDDHPSRTFDGVGGLYVSQVLDHLTQLVEFMYPSDVEWRDRLEEPAAQKIAAHWEKLWNLWKEEGN